LEIPVHTDAALLERSWGVLDGKIGNEHAEERKRCLGWNQAPENGETYAQVTVRTWDCYCNTIRPLLVSGQSVLVLSHHGAMSTLVSMIEELPWGEWDKVGLPTCGYRIYEAESLPGQMH
jgi:broad specificity phosphatase PhoE